MYATAVIEGGGTTANTMAYLVYLGYLLLVAPDTKWQLLDENGVIRGEYEHWGNIPQWVGG